ncbi:MAG: DUF342 domain-containing protein [Lachnotalea sp.]
MNGYFQLLSKTDGTYLKLIPATSDGQDISINDINEYLNLVRMYEYDIKQLNAAVANLNEIMEFKLNSENLAPISENMIIEVKEDKMQVTARFYPPSDKGTCIDYNDILSNISAKGIKVGVNKEVIEGFLKDKKYCQDYIIAQGIKITQGHDAQINYSFNTDLNVKPKVNKDGTVDFHHLDNIGHIHKGQVLATLIPEDVGKPGINVFGEIIKQPSYTKLKLRYGKNITCSEDKCVLTSEVDGHASLVDAKVFVSNVFEVQDVDTSTGNIDFEGNVLVKGNVRSGFEIVTRGNIEVHGVVEGATLIAGGQIVLERGIQGMTKGMLKAGGNIITKFIENAHVEADGFVQTESILHSTVAAKGEVIVQGKKGFVTGGVVTSLTGVSACTIGSPMGTDTRIEVGIDPAMKEHQHALLKEIEEMQKKISMIDPVLSNFMKKISQGNKFNADQMSYAKKLSDEHKEIDEKIKEAQVQIDNINSALNLAHNARIKVSGKIYTDVKLTISDCVMYVREERDHCQFVKDQGEVKILTL